MFGISKTMRVVLMGLCMSQALCGQEVDTVEKEKPTKPIPLVGIIKLTHRPFDWDDMAIGLAVYVTLQAAWRTTEGVASNLADCCDEQKQYSRMTKKILKSLAYVASELQNYHIIFV